MQVRSAVTLWLGAWQTSWTPPYILGALGRISSGGFSGETFLENGGGSADEVVAGGNGPL